MIKHTGLMPWMEKGEMEHVHGCRSSDVLMVDEEIQRSPVVSAVLPQEWVWSPFLQLGQPSGSGDAPS